MRRRLLSLLCVLFMLTSSAVLVSWVASFGTPHSVPLYRGTVERRLVFARGWVQVWNARRFDVTRSNRDGGMEYAKVPAGGATGFLQPTGSQTWSPLDLGRASWPPVRRLEAFRGVEVPVSGGRYTRSGIEAKIVAVPHWRVAVLLLAVAVPGIRRLVAFARRRRRASAGLCPR